MNLIEGKIYLINGNRARFVKYYSTSKKFAKFQMLEGFDPNKPIAIGLKDNGVRIVAVDNVEIYEA